VGLVNFYPGQLAIHVFILVVIVFLHQPPAHLAKQMHQLEINNIYTIIIAMHLALIKRTKVE
jgi:hypothetical protein